MQTTTETPAAALQPVPAPLCSHPGCTELAVTSYLYDWGDRGNACATHMINVRQTADNTARGVTFLPIASSEAPPVERPERIALKSQAYAAEMDAQDARERGKQLYHQNTGLAAQVQALQARERHLTAELAHTTEQLSKASRQLERVEAENTQLVDELSRTKLLVSVADGEPTQITGGPRMSDAQRISMGLPPTGEPPPPEPPKDEKSKGKGK